MALDDPYTLTDLRHYSWLFFVNGNNDTVYRELVSPRLKAERTGIIIMTGQSNNANAALDGFYTPVSPHIHELNIHDCGLYRSHRGRMLGCNGFGQASAVPMADLLIARGYFDRVILVPIAIGGSSAAHWAAGGILNHRIGVTARRLAALGLPPTLVYRHQGETDHIDGTTQSAYATAVLSEIATWRAVGIGCPIFVCLASRIPGPSISDAIRAAQASVVDNVTVFAGSDTDVLGFEYRLGNDNNPDLNYPGILAKAELDATVIGTYLDAH